MSATNCYFYKGSENVLDKVASTTTIDDPLDRVRDSFSKVLDVKNLSFLLGSGCSSLITSVASASGTDQVEVGVPVMAEIAKIYYEKILKPNDKLWLKNKQSLDVDVEPFKLNLETFMSTLYSLHYFNSQTKQLAKSDAQKVARIISNTRDYLLQVCLNETNSKAEKDKELHNLYELFYRKLLFRNANLPRPNIFTTNYDLYSETALDRQGIYYVNGFSGGIRKYFNPTIFNYALAEKMDLIQNKWSQIDNFVYLYKLHGSLNWIEAEDDTKLFKIREIQETNYDILKSKEVIMIYPTPLKYNVSLGSPYSDLFREFQKKLMQANNVLVSIGYSFSDSHINNLIYQAFTIPSFRLIIIGDPASSLEIEKLRLLDDPRVWLIGGVTSDGKKLHYFKEFITRILPDLSNDDVDNKIENAIKTLLTLK